MLVLVHCPMEASSTPPCIEMEIEATGSVGSLKALVTSQIGVVLSERVLVHHGMVLADGASLSSIVDADHASERIAAVVQMLHQPKKQRRMETQLADGCTCGNSKFMLTPTLPPLEQLVDGPSGAEAMSVLRSILYNQTIVRQMRNYFQCPICSDADLSHVFDVFHAKVVSLQDKTASIFSFCESRRDEMCDHLKSFLQRIIFVTKVAVSFRSTPLSLEEAREVFTMSNYEMFATFMESESGLGGEPRGISEEALGRAIRAAAAAHGINPPAEFALPSSSASSSTTSAAHAASRTSSNRPGRGRPAAAAATAAASGATSSAGGVAAASAPPAISTAMFQQALSQAMSGTAAAGAAGAAGAAQGSGGSSASSSAATAYSSGVRTQANPSSSSSSLQQQRNLQRRTNQAAETQRSRYSDQLTTMQMMGLENDGINLQALIATEGDVNAACELVMSGAFS